MPNASIENMYLAQSFGIKYESKLYFDLLAIAKKSVAMVNFKFAIIIPFTISFQLLSGFLLLVQFFTCMYMNIVEIEHLYHKVFFYSLIDLFSFFFVLLYLW